MFSLATFFCFFSLVACLFKEKEKKPRKFSVCVALGFIKAVFLHIRYSVYSSVRVFVESPIYLIIGQGAVNAATHNQPTILQDFLPRFLLALCNNIEYAIENILRIYQKSLFHLRNLKIQPLIICVPLALHWIICDI